MVTDQEYKKATDELREMIVAARARAEAAEAEIRRLQGDVDTLSAALRGRQWRQTGGDLPDGDFEIKFRASKNNTWENLLRNFVTENEDIWWGDPGVMWRPIPYREPADD